MHQQVAQQLNQIGGNYKMASVTKQLYKGTLSASNATLYTSPSTGSSYVVIKTITICNETGVDGWITLALDGAKILYQQLIPAKKSLIMIDLDHVIQASDIIEGLANTADTITVYISGKEVAP